MSEGQLGVGFDFGTRYGSGVELCKRESAMYTACVVCGLRPKQCTYAAWSRTQRGRGREQPASLSEEPVRKMLATRVLHVAYTLQQ